MKQWNRAAEWGGGSLLILDCVLYIFFSTSFSPVFLIDWPGGLQDPESDEEAELHKEPGL